MGEISINGSGLSTMCRLCLSRGVTVLDIFDFSCKMSDNLADVIMTCAPVQVSSLQFIKKLWFTSQYVL